MLMTSLEGTVAIDGPNATAFEEQRQDSSCRLIQFVLEANPFMALHTCRDPRFERGGKTPRIIDLDT
jgi:hypothetical protein